MRRAALGALGFASGEQVLPALLAGLADSEWQVREEAATVIGKLRLAAAGALVAALDDPYWQVRLRAARSLGRLREHGAVTPLAALLTHRIANLRKESALALGEIGAPEALAALESAEADPDPEVRKSVRLALTQIAAAATRASAGRDAA